MQANLQRRQALTDARRALVLDAARAVFLEAGIEGASIREIARKAGYTPGAIYSYFESKEAIYAALLDESIQRLQAAVTDAPVFDGHPERTLAAKAQAWFDFYAANPRELDLGFYLVQGMRPRGLTSELDNELNDHLRQALRPCEDALQAMGLDADGALQENTSLFAHGVGLLLMQHTGRIRMFRQSADALFKTYVAQLVQRVAAHAGQLGLFGGTV
ncbi:transcriptional regulator, TetR family [Variovorax sp. OK605]|jgi:AcrR family transcriptional regulator|uniref:TetR/AcrR family transcriptional regulator n=1 Tax=unclassified Variovorax TaxID=663243 RepID=UPI0008B7776D|nr:MULTISPECIES: TetR/AcrR family transcriptional regulator [unclassified Variovorax]SEK06576.1 transcriptional regulator, TetR family [Variovorax sp. OK202]SFD47027.1 transcriptional regulator, TetR family [Variovorax sp. OK212]SFO62988.1 transcriptional regulator, TetR family [Variovorax sp. OK605]